VTNTSCVFECSVEFLSQRPGADSKLHPCAFFSCRLSPAQRNYDVGNWELLAIKLALEEWRHWLEGAVQPLIVWTDHRNLEYIHSARRLNSRQACWALFFARFNFSITYRPGHKNTKPDALSHQFTLDNGTPTPDTILPASSVLGTINWEIETAVREAQFTQPGPGGGPPDCLFDPPSVRSWVLQWAHDSRHFGHPGIRRTIRIRIVLPEFTCRRLLVPVVR